MAVLCRGGAGVVAAVISPVSVTNADYRWVKFGGRFSVKAFMPSVWSSVANVEWNSLRS